MNERILVVEDDPLTADGVAFALRDEGFEVEVTADGFSALEWARAHTPHLVVLGIGLRNGISGMEVCRELRRESAAPILMLSSRDTEVDTVLGLEGGADDYVKKPFSLVEVVARVVVTALMAELAVMGIEALVVAMLVGVVIVLATVVTAVVIAAIVMTATLETLVDYVVLRPWRVVVIAVHAVVVVVVVAATVVVVVVVVNGTATEGQAKHCEEE